MQEQFLSRFLKSLHVSALNEQLMLCSANMHSRRRLVRFVNIKRDL